jgi:hypothetical protein
MHAADGPSGCAEEVRPILPADIRRTDEPQVGLGNQRGRLQRLAGPLGREVAVREPPQLVVNEGEEFVRRRAITLLRTGEQQCDGERGASMAVLRAAGRRVFGQAGILLVNDSRPTGPFA